MQTEAQHIYPALNEGEAHLCAFLNKDGTTTHTILMTDSKADINWQDAMDWAKALGGDLPTRAELILLYENHKDQFKKDWYWSSTQHVSNSGYAWCHYFSHGGQDLWHEGNQLRARAVRRLVI